MSKLKNLVNVDMIRAFMDINNLSSSEFCAMCKITEEELNSVLKRQLTSVPYFLDNIANVLNIPLKYLVNFDLIKKYYPIFTY